MEFARQGQHLARIATPDSPFKQASVLVELDNIPQPFRARWTRNNDDNWHIARPYTTADGQLNSLQQSPFPPFILQPLDRNFGQIALDIAATAPSTDRNLSDHEALRFQRTISIPVHGALFAPAARSHSIQEAVEFVHIQRSM